MSWQHLMIKAFDRLLKDIYLFKYFICRTKIKDYVANTQLAKVDTPDILHCYEKRTFWLSWDNNTVILGTGEMSEGAHQ